MKFNSNDIKCSKIISTRRTYMSGVANLCPYYPQNTNKYKSGDKN